MEEKKIYRSRSMISNEILKGSITTKERVVRELSHKIINEISYDDLLKLFKVSEIKEDRFYTGPHTELEEGNSFTIL